MDEIKGRWIWLKGDDGYEENTVGCFVEHFSIDKTEREITLSISADARYLLYVNGETVGNGPIRSTRENWYYDTYDLSQYVMKGENFIAFRVWNYGVSNYQYIHNRAGLLYSITCEGKIIGQSNKKTKSAKDISIKSHTVKRNVNLGHMEYCNSNLFDNQWITNSSISKSWGESEEIKNHWGSVYTRPIKHFNSEYVMPKHIVAIEEVECLTQQVSINLRESFFPRRKDANSSIVSGFIATIIIADEDMEGEIVFPFRMWNGIIGDFKINGCLFTVSDADRQKKIKLYKGKNVFLMQISGKFDDLYCHVDFLFKKRIKFENPKKEKESAFIVCGPTALIEENIDGKHDIYGGTIELKRMENHSSKHEEIFNCNSLEDLLKYGDSFSCLPTHCLFFDENIYSRTKNDVVVNNHPIMENNNGIIWNNSEKTMLHPSKNGNDVRIILDMGDIYVGEYEIGIKAQKDTRLEIYGFENMFGHEIDYTVGLNNSIVYICKEGFQNHRFMTRVGARFIVLTFRNMKSPVSLYRFRQRHHTYATSNQGTFKCDDYLLNKIWDISKQTHLLCVEDVFTDCPTYEQAFWIGDAQISANVNALLFGEFSLIRHSLLLTKLMKNNTPLINALGPTDWNTSIPMWTMNWFLSIKQYIDYSGDESILELLYDTVKTTLYYYAGFITEDNLFLVNAWNMLDWAPLDISNHCVVTGQQAILAYCFTYFCGIAEKNNQVEDAHFFRTCSERLLAGINETLWDAKTNMFYDGFSPEKGYSITKSIQTHTLLYLFDGITDSKKQEIVQMYMCKKPDVFVDVGSPFMLFYVYEVWAKFNKLDSILDDIRQQWGKMLKYDSTTCWEVFPGFYEVGRTRSYCHSWSTSPVYFLSKYTLGIVSISDGWKNIVIQPPETNLKWCEGSVPTPFGTIYIKWTVEKKSQKYCIIVPKEITVNFLDKKNWDIEIVTK